MSKFPSLESRSLKRKSLWPPDVYTQQPNQLEDALTEEFVKDGFKYTKPVADEYDSGRSICSTVALESVWDLYYNIVIRKAQTSNLFDSKKRCSTNIKDTVVPVGNLNQSQTVEWFSELSKSCSLSSLGKTVPFLNKYIEEALSDLFSYRVPYSRALWFISMNLAQPTAPEISKKKVNPKDPTVDWTLKLISMLDQLFRVDFSSIKFEDFGRICIEWDYLFGLLMAMYDNDLAEHSTVLKWLVSKIKDSYDKCMDCDSSECSSLCSIKGGTPHSVDIKFQALKFMLVYIQRFGLRFTESEILTRKLLYWSCSAFSKFVLHCTYNSSSSLTFDKPKDYIELLACSYHRPFLYSISSIIISLTLTCPSAAVWNKISTDTNHIFLCGSPLDLLPCSLAFLPIPPGPEASRLRTCLVDTESALVERGKLAETGWCLLSSLGIGHENHFGETTAEMFCRVLDILDSQDFSESIPIQNLFRKCFQTANLENAHHLGSLVTFLCRWAVSPTRAGLHRSIIVANLLENLKDIKSNQSFLQVCLITFLDQHAPCANETGCFRALVCLFGELIDRGIFDHDSFVRTFIARGVFDSSMHPCTSQDSLHLPLHSIQHPTSNSTARNQFAMGCSSSSLLPPTNLSGNFSVQSEVSEDNDRNSVDNPDSVRSDAGGMNTILSANSRQSNDLNRHLLYLINFPIPQDDSYAHEQNQRAKLLYGNLRARYRARDTIRKFVRDLGKLFAYRLDVIHGDLVRRKKNREPSIGMTTPNSQRVSKETRSLDDLIEDIITRFQALSYYDMECIISKSMPGFLKMLGDQSTATICANLLGDLSDPIDTSTGSPSTFNSLLINNEAVYVPVPCAIFLYFELIETSLNVTCLLYTVADTLERLQMTSLPHSQGMSSYMSLVMLRIVGVLRSHFPVLRTMHNLQKRIIASLVDQISKWRGKAQCKHCMVNFLKDLVRPNFIALSVLKNFVQTQNEVFDGVLSIDFVDDLLTNRIPDSRAAVQVCARNYLVSPEARNSFVLKAVVAVGEARTSDRLAYLFDLFAELSAYCEELTANWPTALNAIMPNNSSDSRVRIEDPLVQNNMFALIGMLLARQCLEPKPFMDVLGLALANGVDQGLEPVDALQEPTVRFACHILHCLFTTEHTVGPSVDQDPQSSYVPFKLADPLLMVGTLRKIPDVSFVDILKMLMIHSNKDDPEAPKADGEEVGDGNNTSEQENSSSDDDHSDSGSEGDNGDYGNSSIDTLDDLDHVDGIVKRRRRRRVHLAASKGGVRKGRRGRITKSKTNSANNHLNNCRVLPNRIHRSIVAFLSTGIPPTDTEVRSLRLRDFAHLVLREICITPWVRELFYRIPQRLLENNMLIDEDFSRSQARYLLHLIYQPQDVKWVDLAAKPENIAEAMIGLLTNVNIWNLSSTRTEFELLCRHIQSNKPLETLSQVAQFLVSKFNEQAKSYLKGVDNSPDNASDRLPDIEIPEMDNMWYLPTLIGQLPEDLQAVTVTRSFDDVLHGIKEFWCFKNDEEKEQIVLQHSVLLAHPVFASILKVCMEKQDQIDQLYDQIEFFLSNAKETRDRMPENLRTRHILQECLSLRLGLLGARINSGFMSTDRISRGALLLAQLIGFGVIEPHSNQTLFFTCLDMLHTLVHNLAAQTSPDSKPMAALNKKLPKELASMEYLRPLLFVGREGYHFVVVNPLKGSGGGSAGNRGDGNGGGGGGGGGRSGTNSKSGGSKMNSKAGGGSGRSVGSGSGGSSRLTSGGGVRSFSRKRGYAFRGRERLAVWHLYDPNWRPQLLAMCGAAYTESTLSRVEEQANRLLSHDHPVKMRRSDDFYFKSIFLPPEPTASDPTPPEQPSAKHFVLGTPMKKTPMSEEQQIINQQHKQQQVQLQREWEREQHIRMNRSVSSNLPMPGPDSIPTFSKNDVLRTLQGISDTGQPIGQHQMPGPYAPAASWSEKCRSGSGQLKPAQHIPSSQVPSNQQPPYNFLPGMPSIGARRKRNRSQQPSSQDMLRQPFGVDPMKSQPVDQSMIIDPFRHQQEMMGQGLDNNSLAGNNNTNQLPSTSKRKRPTNRRPPNATNFQQMHQMQQQKNIENGSVMQTTAAVRNETLKGKTAADLKNQRIVSQGNAYPFDAYPPTQVRPGLPNQRSNLSMLVQNRSKKQQQLCQQQQQSMEEQFASQDSRYMPGGVPPLPNDAAYGFSGGPDVMGFLNSDPSEYVSMEPQQIPVRRGPSVQQSMRYAQTPDQQQMMYSQPVPDPPPYHSGWLQPCQIKGQSVMQQQPGGLAQRNSSGYHQQIQQQGLPPPSTQQQTTSSQRTISPTSGPPLPPFPVQYSSSRYENFP